MYSKAAVKIENRVHLLSTLAEAAELEHNLMCMYLYSVFSFKTTTAEGLTSEEMDAVNGWRKTILNVCVEEMTHLALVANLTTAVGGGAHFFRPEFPVRPGYFPSEFVLELAPFNQETLQHFIFLERPEDEPVEDADEFTPEKEYTRSSSRGRLLDHAGDYSIVGQLYEAIAHGVVSLSSALGETNLFCGSPSLQISPDDVELKGLAVVNDKASAMEVLRLIVEQGEGARTTKGSHYEKFTRIAEEYDVLLRRNPRFEPSRPTARNPAMRKPTTPEGRLWVNQTPAADYLDLANALYGLMLRFLVQVYSMENRSRAAKKTLLEAAFSLMHAVGAIAGLLTKFPASLDCPGTTAGINFALNRYFTPSELTSEKLLLIERLDDILDDLRTLRDDAEDQRAAEREELAESLDSVKNMLGKVRESLEII
jgi:Ferritin-like